MAAAMENRETQGADGAPLYKSPVRKLVEVFRTGRDGWKAKHQALKSEIKGMANQVRAVEKSRELWRSCAQAAADKIVVLENELRGLQGEQLEVVKKKRRRIVRLRGDYCLSLSATGDCIHTGRLPPQGSSVQYSHHFHGLPARTSGCGFARLKRRIFEHALVFWTGRRYEGSGLEYGSSLAVSPGALQTAATAASGKRLGSGLSTMLYKWARRNALW